ncbi:Na+/H+-dicarboxylate symporter [Sphingomonas sp. BE270]|jgi:proton glutamate symport protein|uniref:dicarboxylate/amino acid:cation symporter n=2 Tax=Pseudomonadota TaxID=1224 RepID=UPI001AE66E9C|nr:MULTISPECIES: cation:dicarboxylase symporter family transporter [unclassified Sphingomonas]MDR6848414.1 Na+/H+-dicarboxylate symporter [Sphingomonas sp. BE137]MDR7259076.1 Na+/H+-dicarboxylate symporter [Sphingomonas sp. BE270]
MSATLNSPSTRILVSLGAGLLFGIVFATWLPGAVPGATAVAQPIGAAWLNALQMTVIPLVFSLLVTGIASTAEAARSGAVAARAISIIVVVMVCSAVAAALLTPLFLGLVPIPEASAAALRGALVNVGPPGAVPPLGEFLAGMVPNNVIAAAANGGFLSLILFALIFAFALTRIDATGRTALLTFFSAIRDAMLVMIGWIIWIAPIGVFALALTVAAKTGTAAVGALFHYIVTVSSVGIVVSLFAVPVAIWGGRMALGRFIRASLPVLAVALSTQSSLASLPAMLRSSEEMDVPVATSGVVLPLAVAMMRATGPAMNLAVAIYVAAWFGVPMTFATLAAATVVAVLTSLGSVSLPGQISFISAIAPIAVTLGVPVAPLGLLVAVETMPDIFRTLGNVIFDLAVTLTVAARGDKLPLSAADTLLQEHPS